MRKFILSGFILLFFLLTYPPLAHAHEAYVLTQDEFQQGLSLYSPNPLGPLLSSDYLPVSIVITIVVVATYLLSILWSTTTLAGMIDVWIRKASIVGPFIIRLAISTSFFFAASSNVIFAPELQLSTVYGGEVIRFLLFVLSIMILFGFLTEIAALVGIVIFGYVSFTYGFYMITYANYFGELLVLFLFGTRFFSVDRLLIGREAWHKTLERYRHLEIPIVRILYGVALIFAGVSIKFFHQSLTVAVYNQYHLINFFHASAEFIAAGAGLTEIAIGFFILIGFCQRLTILISLVFITLSLLYFRELLWPHVMLYGISFSLLINSADQLTVDRYLIPFVRKTLFSQKYQ